jgi:hypothetical protein
MKSKLEINVCYFHDENTKIKERMKKKTAEMQKQRCKNYIALLVM